MAPPLAVLKLGLGELQNQTKQKRELLLERVRQQEKLSAEDESWLDKEGNLVDEEGVLDVLSNALDYESAFGGLTAHQKSIADRLLKVGKSAKKTGNKRKRSSKAPETAPVPSTSTTPTKKENATLAQRIEILDWHHQSPHKNQVKTARHWDTIYPTLKLKQPIISQWLKDEQKWRTQWGEAQSRGQASSKRVRLGNFPDVNDTLELYVAHAMACKLRVGGELIRQKWGVFADLEGVLPDERLALSSGWLEAMKKRCGLRDYRIRGDGAIPSVDGGDVDSERARMRGVVARYNYPLRNIFNMDETSLCYAMPPDRSLISHTITNQLTVALTANADGTEKLPPFIIGKTARPPAFHQKSAAQLGFYYRNNAMAWLTITLYQEWLSDWDEKLRKEGRHVLLLQDDFGVHRPPDGLTNIRVENFMGSSTAYVQPNEAGVIRCFKARYRERFIHRAIDRYDVGVGLEQVYEIDQLEAMRMIEAAWREVDAETIHACWRRTGILPGLVDVPPPPQHIPQDAEMRTMNQWYDGFAPSTAWEEPDASTSWVANPVPLPVPTPHIFDNPKTITSLTDALYQLEGCGLLQSYNRLTLEDIINPPFELFMAGDTSDEEIYRAVKEMRRIERESDGDGASGEGDGRPTRKEALMASFVVQRYLLDVNAPFARGLEGALLDFGRLTRSEDVAVPARAAVENGR